MAERTVLSMAEKAPLVGRMYINGEWTPSEGGEYFDAYNPATLEVIARIPKGTREDAQRAIMAANGAKTAIGNMPVWERAKLLNRVADSMESRKEDLAQSLSE